MGQNAPYELPVKIFGTLFIYLLHGNYLSMNHKKELKFSMPICLFMNLHGIKNFNYLLIMILHGITYLIHLPFYMKSQLKDNLQVRYPIHISYHQKDSMTLFTITMD